jgi:hypothetical protein
MGAVLQAWWLPALVILAYALNWLRTAMGLRRSGLTAVDAMQQAAFLCLSKLPAIQGMFTYHLRRLRGEPMRLIEYK